MKLKIEYLPIEEVQPYVNNAKIHTKTQIEQIKKSIEEFGFNDPVAIWHDNEIIEGHGRVLAALALGINTIPVIRLDDLTDEQRKAYMLAHNKLTMNTDFDGDLLSLELDSIVDIDMSDFGFDIDVDSEVVPVEQRISDGKEINVDDFGDEEFEYECQKCGFRFNRS